jgi:hypothetical protein
VLLLLMHVLLLLLLGVAVGVTPGVTRITGVTQGGGFEDLALQCPELLQLHVLPAPA